MLNSVVCLDVLSTEVIGGVGARNEAHGKSRLGLSICTVNSCARRSDSISAGNTLIREDRDSILIAGSNLSNEAVTEAKLVGGLRHCLGGDGACGGSIVGASDTIELEAVVITDLQVVVEDGCTSLACSSLSP